MCKPIIPITEFKERISKLKIMMQEKGFDALLVYGDEYRKENLRYVSNYWPIFERGAMLLSLDGEPIVLCAPEGQKLAEEMSAWKDIRLLPNFLCVTVPDEIDYPYAHYTSFGDLSNELSAKRPMKKLGISGMDAMSEGLLETIRKSFQTEIVNANNLLFTMRMEKSKNEIACITEAARIADAAYHAMMDANLIGLTELQAAGIAEHEARKQGAEHIIFTVFGSGDRSASIVGRPTRKIIKDGDMIMCALAVQYEGYVATCEVPFAVGNMGTETKRVIDVLIRAHKAGCTFLKAGEPMKNFVRAVKQVFSDEGLSQYDVYPPLHGIGCAEAESPYPDENEQAPFRAGMTVNTDISLFGFSGGSNRIEEGYVITESGADSLSPLVKSYCETWLKMNT